MPYLDKAIILFKNWLTENNRENNINNQTITNFLGSSGFDYIKSYSELCWFAALLEAQKYSIPIPPCTPLEFAMAIKYDIHNRQHAPEIPKDIQSIELAAGYFKQWFTIICQDYPNYSTNSSDFINMFLITFLVNTEGLDLIRSYEDLCQLAHLLMKQDYQITVPPSITPSEFATIVEEADIKQAIHTNKQFSTELSYYPKHVLPKNISLIELAAKSFSLWEKENYLKTIPFTDDHISKRYTEDGYISCFADPEDDYLSNPDKRDNGKLMDFLKNYAGFRYIKSYENLCSLAVILKEKGYQISNPPCTPLEYARIVWDILSNDSFKAQGLILPETVKLVELIADKFYEYSRDGKKASGFTDKYNFENEALNYFFKKNNFFDHIKKYDELKNFAAIIQEKGFYNSYSNYSYPEFMSLLWEGKTPSPCIFSILTKLVISNIKVFICLFLKADKKDVADRPSP